MYDLNVQQYCAAGLNFGYYYDQSPIIYYDDEEAPGYSMSDYQPSTVPGCRAPHVWFGNGRSLYDVMGSDYTLLRFDPDLDVEPLTSAAAVQRLPLTVCDLPRCDDYANWAFVLVRPDQHIAWRGQALPDNPEAFVRKLRGLKEP